ncbi:MAG: hypothetical protein ACI8PZ_000152 [Myxococcota bacterium]|jgi:hypothetical protein
MTGRFRVLLAVWTLAYLWPRWPYIGELWARPILRQDPWFMAAFTPPTQWAVHGLLGAATIAALAMIIGRRVRIAHAVMLVVFALLIAFDTRMARGYGVLALVQWALLWFAPHAPGERGANWGATLLKLQFSSVYLFTIPAKLVGGRGWWDGKSLFHVLNDDTWGLFGLAAGGVSRNVATAMSWGTLGAELFIALGLWWPRTRVAAAITLVGLHLGIGLSLRISPLFHLLMAAHLALWFGSQKQGEDQ